MRDKDYAVVVGINKYPSHDEYDDLKGAKRDAEEFLAWVTSPKGGNINAHSRISKHCSNKTGTEPRLDHIVESIDDLMDLQERHGRVGRRLYIFVAGHGAGKNTTSPVLLAADHRPRRPSYFEGRKIADMFIELAAFREVVLFMDCCRDQVQGLGAGVHFEYEADTDAANVKQCYAFGTLVNRQSFERKFGAKYHGVFSYVLLEGLKGGAANEDGTVTAGSLEDFVQKRFDDLKEDPPQFLAPDRSLVLVKGVIPTLAPVEIRLGDPAAGFEVRDGKIYDKVLDVKREKLADDRWRIHVRPERLYLVGVPGSDDMKVLRPGVDHVEL